MHLSTMANTIRKKDITQQLAKIRNTLIKDMHKGDYTIEEISSIVRLNKAGISRVIRFGSNINAIKKGDVSNIKK